jgi:hypothetical protein
MTPDPPATPAHGLTPRSFLGVAVSRHRLCCRVPLHGIGGRRDLPLPFKLIVAGSAAAGYCLAGGRQATPRMTKAGDRLTCDATPSKPNKLRYRLRPPANEEAELNARPTMINTAARR